ncbi:two-component sensor histidine kinase [Vibrio albus]|uniref:histidine kinase n=1 Tax=Vibrio albus TaxID=2200953 RepID=A0A2U3BBV7_9VIBR|nr:HAMP domain-containing sensor histidine kinase [Vibrio albus]PWI34214.1 two-component sensor histidine kinase [Vibrio albus]
MENLFGLVSPRNLAYKIKTKVRYRLLFLTSMPIFITMFALVMITIYWATHYTWQNALDDVSERLKTAEIYVSHLHESQNIEVTTFEASYSFRQKLRASLYDVDELNSWLKSRSTNDSNVCLRWRNPKSVSSGLSDISSGKGAFYQVLSKDELQAECPELAKKASVAVFNEQREEERALVSRIIYPVYDENRELRGYLDSIHLINNNQKIVDDIKELVYPDIGLKTANTGAVTIFLEDLRISTNVPLNEGEPARKAVGTRVSQRVKHTVLERGESYLDRAYVHNAWYVSAYIPLRDINSNIVGMLYVGHQIWPLIEAYIINLGEIALMVFLVLLISGYIVHFGTRDLFHPIEKISSVVKGVQNGKVKRIGNLQLSDKHELAELARQFDQMLDQLDFRNQQIKQAAAQLETKVAERTASLHEKTEQLEHHITLLNQTRDKLIVSEKLAALGQLTAGIAHEINNPVAVILGNAELIQMELGEDATDVNEELTVIFEQVRRIRNITQSLLQYSRNRGKDEVYSLQDINSIVAESITLVKTGSKKKNVSFITNYSATALVECSRNQLLQVLINLQVNAVQAMGSKGTIYISTENWVEESVQKGGIIHIEDEGNGIRKEDIPKVFDPFYTTKTEGTGLGLSVSQGLLHRIGAEIHVESEHGKGARFSLYLRREAIFS